MSTGVLEKKQSDCKELGKVEERDGEGVVVGGMVVCGGVVRYRHLFLSESNQVGGGVDG